MNAKLQLKELSLRPYHGRLFLAKTKKAYLSAHKCLFKMSDVLTCAEEGRFNGGEGKDGMWTYLIWAESAPILAHELSHAILHTFERCGIDPRSGNGEPFCYLLSALMKEAQISTLRNYQ